jgi:hypothetical protein
MGIFARRNSMKVKEFMEKYKDYSIELVGRPLSQNAIPYTFLPRDKELDECEVVEYETKEKEFVQHCYNLESQTWRKENKKGYVRAYIK